MSPQKNRKSASTHVLSVGGRSWPPTEGDLKRALKTVKTTDPTVDPSTVYPEVIGLPDTYNTFRLDSDGLPHDKREAALRVAKEYHVIQKAHFLGYQCNYELHFSKDFTNYLDIHVNNIGDPFTSGNFTVNSKFMERALLDYYASLWNARWPHQSKDPESYWGFALTMGSTEGNLYGMWNARDYLGGKKILIDTTPAKKKTKRQRTSRGSHPFSAPRLVYHQAPVPEDNENAYTPIAFFSQDTHYSLSKAMTMLAIRTFYEEGRERYINECPLEDWKGEGWPEEVPSLDSGAIDIEALAKLVEFFAAKGYPILVNFNYGTTFKGAYDDVAAAGNTLLPILAKYGLDERKVYYNPDNPQLFDVRTGYWFHVDGALGAAYMPFIESAYNAKLIDERGPDFDFRLPFVHSIAMSGHKWIGSTVPCGIFMTRTKYQMLPPEIPEYIGTPDTTFAGSRNGFSAMLLWDYTARHSFSQEITKALRLESLAQYVERRLHELEQEIKTDLWVTRTPLSLTIHFRRPNEEIQRRFSLSNENLDGRAYSHLFVMEHVTTHLVEEFIHELSQAGAFPPEPIAPKVVVKAAHLAPEANRGALVPHESRGFRG